MIFRKDDSGDKLRMVIAFFVIAPVISITLAYFGVNYFLMPKLGQGNIQSCEQEEYFEQEIEDNTGSNLENNEAVEYNFAQEDNNTSSKKIDDISFFTVQMGCFSTIENAKVFVSELKENDISAFVVKVGENFKVYSGVFTSKTQADVRKEQIKKNYNDVFVSSNIASGGNVNYSDNENELVDKYIELISCLAKFYEQENDAFVSTVHNDNLENVTKTIANNNKIFKEKLSELEKENSNNEQLKRLNNQLSQHLQKRLQLTSNIQTTDIVSGYNQYSECMVEYLSIIQVK